MTPESPFTLYDIEDVKLIVKANGKHYGIIPKGDRDMARLVRIALLTEVLHDYFVVDTPLESLKSDSGE